MHKKQEYLNEISLFPDSPEKLEVLNWLQSADNFHKETNPEKHLGVVVYVTNPENDKVFLLNHKKAKTYLMPGGHVDKGNGLVQTAVEELSEELELDILGYRLQPIHIAQVETQGTNSGHTDVTLCYKIEVADPESVGGYVQQKEVDEACWFNINKASKLPDFTNLPAVNEKVKDQLAQEIQKLSGLPIETVVFDYGGVFADHYCSPYFENFANELGVNIERAGELVSEKSDHGQKYRLNQISREEFWQIVITGGNNPSANIDNLEAQWEQSYQVDPRMLSVAHKLKKAGKNIALLMNTDQRRLEYIKANPIITKYVDSIFTSCEIGLMKPDKSLFSEVLRSLRVNPENVIYLDDRSSHTQSARELGINSIDYEPIGNITSQILSYKKM